MAELTNEGFAQSGLVFSAGFFLQKPTIPSHKLVAGTFNSLPTSLLGPASTTVWPVTSPTAPDIPHFRNWSGLMQQPNLQHQTPLPY